jgi:hypothetical protein
VTLDRDYLDDRRFPPERTAGVLVLSAPDERALAKLLTRLARALFSSDPEPTRPGGLLPLEGRKLHASSDWHPDAR